MESPAKPLPPFSVLRLAWDVCRVAALALWAWLQSLYLLLVPPEPRDVSGDIVLVTGAGHGIGRELALQFAALRATVVCVDRDAAGNADTARAVKDAEGTAFKYECDVTDRAAVAALAARVRREVGDVTMLVNNAGVLHARPLLDSSERELRRTVDVNFTAQFWTLQAFLPAMLAANRGHVVCLSSLAGHVGVANMAAYCATKFAVRGLMEALAVELRQDARDYSGVKLTTVQPHIVNTGLCKNPRFRFPALHPLTPPRAAAAAVVDAVRRGHPDVTVPGYFYYVVRWLQTLPRGVRDLLLDFDATLVDPDTDADADAGADADVDGDADGGADARAVERAQ